VIANNLSTCPQFPNYYKDNVKGYNNHVHIIMNVKFVTRLHYVSLAYINLSTDKPHLPNVKQKWAIGDTIVCDLWFVNMYKVWTALKVETDIIISIPPSCDTDDHVCRNIQTWRYCNPINNANIRQGVGTDFKLIPNGANSLLSSQRVVDLKKI
jgi:hypothetical protein